MSKHKSIFRDYKIGDFVVVDDEFTGTITYIYDDSIADVEVECAGQIVALPFSFKRLKLMNPSEESIKTL